MNDRDRGAVLAVAAVAIVVLLVMSALTLDLGRQMVERRDAQRIADVVALDLVRLVDGRSSSAIESDPNWTRVLDDAADRNGWDAAQIEAETGTFDGDTFTPGGAAPDAVQVTVAGHVRYDFARIVGFTGGRVSRSSVANRINTADFAVGSLPVELRAGDAALLDPLTSSLLGGPVVLDPSTYQRLADDDATLGQLAAAAGTGRVDTLLGTDFSVREVAELAADVLGPPDAVVFNDLALAATVAGDIRLGDLVAVDASSPTAAAVTVNLFELLLGAAQLANGANLVDYSSAVPPMTPPSGVANLSMSTQASVAQGPRSCGACALGDSARTAQAEVHATALFDVTFTAGSETLTGTVALPLVVGGGDSRATLTRLACAVPASSSVIDLRTETSAVTAALAGPLTTLQDSGSDVATVGADLDATPGAAVSTDVTDIGIGQTKTTGTAGVSLGSLLAPGDLDVNMLSSPGGITAADVANGLAPILDDVLGEMGTALTPLLDTLGLTLGAAEDTGLGVHCGTFELRK